MQWSIAAATFFTGLIALAHTAQAQQVKEYAQEQEAGTVMNCFYKSEEASPLNKICYYDCMGSKAAMNVRPTDVCPLTFKHGF